jgi:ribose 5-phosphate isomerase A
VHSLDFYVDGADEYNDRKELIKGGGGALTREKILAYSSESFICIVDETKHTDLLGREFPLAIEVIEIARSAVSRELMKMGGKPIFRNGFTSDNGNQIVDVHNFPIEIPYELEAEINNIPGVVENGIFAKRKADVIICATDNSINILD